jgi:hypothetical protein
MEIKKGDRVITPQGEACTVLGLSMAGRATIVADDGKVIAIDAELLQVIERTFLD